jgi:hypothetical protein
VPHRSSWERQSPDWHTFDPAAAQIPVGHRSRANNLRKRAELGKHQRLIWAEKGKEEMEIGGLARGSPARERQLRKLVSSMQNDGPARPAHQPCTAAEANRRDDLARPRINDFVCGFIFWFPLECSAKLPGKQLRARTDFGPNQCQQAEIGRKHILVVTSRFAAVFESGCHAIPRLPCDFGVANIPAAGHAGR